MVSRHITLLVVEFSFIEHLVKFVIPEASSNDFIAEHHRKECCEVNLAFTFRLQSVGKSSELGTLT